MATSPRFPLMRPHPATRPTTRTRTLRTARPRLPAVAVPLDTFFDSLSHVGLVYLSSCQSSSESIVFGLVDQSVPAIIGFRWPIRDDLAVAFAKGFYEAIIVNGMHLGPAFVAGRRNLNANFPRTPHWFGATSAGPVEFLSLIGRQGERAHVRVTTSPKT